MSDISIVMDFEESEDLNEGTVLQSQLEQVEHEISQIEREVSRLQERKRGLSQKREEVLQRIQADQMAPRRDWGHDTFKWDDDVQRILHDIFKLQDFRRVECRI